MGLFNMISNAGSSLWQGAKNIGDFVGLDGSLGYDGTWSNQNQFAGVQPWHVQTSYNNPSANMTNYNSAVPSSNGLFGSLSDWYNNQNSQDWKNYANIAGTLGGLGLGYMQYKDAHNLQKQQLADMEFNRRMAEKQYQNKVDTDNALSTGFQGSGLYDMYKKKHLAG